MPLPVNRPTIEEYMQPPAIANWSVPIYSELTDTPENPNRYSYFIREIPGEWADRGNAINRILERFVDIRGFSNESNRTFRLDPYLVWASLGKPIWDAEPGGNVEFQGKAPSIWGRLMMFFNIIAGRTHDGRTKSYALITGDVNTLINSIAEMGHSRGYTNLVHSSSTHPFWEVGSLQDNLYNAEQMVGATFRSVVSNNQGRFKTTRGDHDWARYLLDVAGWMKEARSDRRNAIINAPIPEGFPNLTINLEGAIDYNVEPAAAGAVIKRSPTGGEAIKFMLKWLALSADNNWEVARDRGDYLRSTPPPGAPGDPRRGQPAPTPPPPSTPGEGTYIPTAVTLGEVTVTNDDGSLSTYGEADDTRARLVRAFFPVSDVAPGNAESAGAWGGRVGRFRMTSGVFDDNVPGPRTKLFEGVGETGASTFGSFTEYNSANPVPSEVAALYFFQIDTLVSARGIQLWVRGEWENSTGIRIDWRTPPANPQQRTDTKVFVPYLNTYRHFSGVQYRLFLSGLPANADTPWWATLNLESEVEVYTTDVPSPAELNTYYSDVREWFTLQDSSLTPVIVPALPAIVGFSPSGAPVPGVTHWQIQFIYAEGARTPRYLQCSIGYLQGVAGTEWAGLNLKFHVRIPHPSADSVVQDETPAPGRGPGIDTRFPHQLHPKLVTRANNILDRLARPKTHVQQLEVNMVQLMRDPRRQHLFRKLLELTAYRNVYIHAGTRFPGAEVVFNKHHVTITEFDWSMTWTPEFTWKVIISFTSSDHLRGDAAPAEEMLPWIIGGGKQSELDAGYWILPAD